MGSMVLNRRRQVSWLALPILLLSIGMAIVLWTANHSSSSLLRNGKDPSSLQVKSKKSKYITNATVSSITPDADSSSILVRKRDHGTDSAQDESTTNSTPTGVEKVASPNITNSVESETTSTYNDNITIPYYNDANNSRERKWMNMDGIPYQVANSKDFDTEWFLKDPTVRSFDVYSRLITSRYAEVHWMKHPSIPLPADVVWRYSATNGNRPTNTMAIVGYEVDQVRIDPNTGAEVPVPSTWAYCHHYQAYFLETRKTYASAYQTYDYIAVRGTAKWVSEGNGGEFRKSYHGYPNGYAQLVQEPYAISITPMQIDTWNRDTMNDTAAFIPPSTDRFHELFPQTSNISPRLLENLDEAGYNPLMECPCTDRLEKTYTQTYKVAKYNSSAPKRELEEYLENSTECFAVAEAYLSSKVIRQRIATDSTNADNRSGVCETILRSDGSLDVVWNTNFNATSDSQDVESAGDLFVGTTPAGSIINATIAINSTSQMVDMTLKGPYLDSIDPSTDRWFAIGFGTSTMCLDLEADICHSTGPYTIVVMPDSQVNATTISSHVVERKLDYHGPGIILDRSNPEQSNHSFVVLSNSIETEAQSGKQRRVVHLTRSLQGPTDDYYRFPVESSQLETQPLSVILATGCIGATEFGRHCGHEAPNPISFVRVGATQELWRSSTIGRLGGVLFDTSKGCLEQPYSDLLAQSNPICELETYQGGLKCCRHGNYLLDKNQSVPWSEQPLEYRLKFRFYYQDYDPNVTAAMSGPHEYNSHLDMERLQWMTDIRIGEYDVPECLTPKDPDSCVHTITSTFQVHEMMRKFNYWNDDVIDYIEGVELIYASAHCHANSCLSMELWNIDTGELLCKVTPVVGESGFLVLPPCLWSHVEDDGLEQPLYLLKNTTLQSVKKANSSYLHMGDMATWQMRGIVTGA